MKTQTTVELVATLRDDIQKAIANEEEHIRSISGPRGRASQAASMAHAANDVRREVLARLEEIILAKVSK
jgi:hypothetical protein